MGHSYTVVAWSPVLLASWIQVAEAASAASAAERVLADAPAWARLRFVAVYDGGITAAYRVEELDLVVEAMSDGRPPPVRQSRGTGMQAFTVAAIWTGTGETLAHEVSAGWVRASDGLEALTLVQTTVARAGELQLVAAFPGHKRPVLSAAAGTQPGMLGPPPEPLPAVAKEPASAEPARGAR